MPTLLPHCRFSFSGSMMNRMSFSETIFLFLLALIIFGPKKLPEIARQVGKYMNEFKRASNEFKAQIEQEISHLDVENRQTVLPPSPPPAGVTSRSLNAAPAETAPAEAPAAEASSKEDPASEISANQVSATPAASDDEPLFATGVGAGSSAPGATDAVSADATSPAAQGSHV
ncbi:MAG: twin-arginine translocase TatA/TatE family subunit [Candidatus Sulfotelmatobacter sp.]